MFRWMKNARFVFLQVLILSPYETGMKPKETMWNTTRSASLTAGDTTSPREHSLTRYRSSSNTTRVRKRAMLPAHFPFLFSLIHLVTAVFHQPLKITFSHTCCSVPPSSFLCYLECYQGRWIACNFNNNWWCGFDFKPPSLSLARGELRLKICDPTSFQSESGEGSVS